MNCTFRYQILFNVRILEILKTGEAKPSITMLVRYWHPNYFCSSTLPTICKIENINFNRPLRNVANVALPCMGYWWSIEVIHKNQISHVGNEFYNILLLLRSSVLQRTNSHGKSWYNFQL